MKKRKLFNFVGDKYYIVTFGDKIVKNNMDSFIFYYFIECIVKVLFLFLFLLIYRFLCMF